MADTKLSLYEIECALAESRKFDYIRNLVVFNVKGQSEVLPLHHECDMLVCSKAGYLTEVEIKRSWSDFIADFNKRHDHSSELIKYFYYAVPVALREKVNEYLQGKRKCGIITYTEDGWIDEYRFCPILSYKKIFLEQKLEMARLGCLRVIGLKQKITELRNGKNTGNQRTTEES